MEIAIFRLSKPLNLALHFGVLAFIPIGIVDQSIVPIPGSVDAMVILFSASKPELWWYYAVWATAGTLIGSDITYRLAQKGGKEALEKKLGKERSDKAHQLFKKWGSWSLFVGAIAPPPVPIVPFLAVAGVMQYPKRLFLGSYGLGRIVRFSLVAWITAKYGKHIFQFFSRYYKPALFSLIALGVLGGALGIWWYVRIRRRKKAKNAGHIEQPRVA
jgi:membrane protein YqaA with SNARE-associated domain